MEDGYGTSVWFFYLINFILSPVFKMSSDIGCTVTLASSQYCQTKTVNKT